MVAGMNQGLQGQGAEPPMDVWAARVLGAPGPAFVVSLPDGEPYAVNAAAAA